MKGRDEYVKWDINTNERKDIAYRLKDRFPELNVQIGGQTGLDISDSDKSQIIKYFNFDDDLHFFGDMMDCLLYTSPSPRDRTRSRMPSSA